jgi:hypothetical protein
MEKNNIEYRHNPLSQFDDIENSNNQSISANKIETTSNEENEEYSTTNEEIPNNNIENNENNINNENSNNANNNNLSLKSKETQISKLNKNTIPNYLKDCNEDEIINEKFIFKFKGRSLFIFGDKYGNPFFIIGPHWPMYFCYCGTVTLFMSIIYFSKYWKKMSNFSKFLGQFIYLFYFIFYTLTFLLNPGYPRNTVGRRIGKPRNDYYFCDICEFWIYKDSLTSHCFDCNICIEGYDHHCPWTGHCIGKKNLFYFYCFLIGSFGIMGFLIFAATCIAGMN